MVKVINFFKYFFSLLFEPRSKFSEEEQRQRAQDSYVYGALIVAVLLVILTIQVIFGDF